MLLRLGRSLTRLRSLLHLDRQIPTILSYVDGEEYYGQQAKNFLVRNSANTVAYFRDFLGQEYVIPSPLPPWAPTYPPVGYQTGADGNTVPLQVQGD